ncbi:hypothetical protein HDV03_003155 [Kappamyces sp. JEL0829]|nr:hypothetical protein HDV03_003155 [Kappamyces sp. JEL0829]
MSDSPIPVSLPTGAAAFDAETPLSNDSHPSEHSDGAQQLAEVDEHASENGEEIRQHSDDHSPGDSHDSDGVSREPGGGLPTTGAGEDACIKFQLIPISETPGKAAVGEVVERRLKERDIIKVGRQVVRDGQATIKGSKKATELDVWFSSKVVSRLHAEIWTKDGQLCIKDVGSSSGTFLNQMRLSPSGKESRPYPLKQGDVIQFGVDFKGKADADVYRAVTMRLGFHDQSWLKAQRKNANPQRFSAALKQLIAATNPYGEQKGHEDEEAGDVDCCICIGAIAPYQALFIAPCSHCYHYKCVGYLVVQSPMFQCPLCRQVANLTASVSSESLNADNKLVVPLPVLEDELEVKKVVESSAANAQMARRASTRRPSLAGAKKIMENLGILSPKEKPISEPSAPGEASSSVPAVAATDADRKPATRGKRAFSFKFRFGSQNDKQQTPEEAAANGNSHVPRSVLGDNGNYVDDNLAANTPASVPEGREEQELRQ